MTGADRTGQGPVGMQPGGWTERQKGQVTGRWTGRWTDKQMTDRQSGGGGGGGGGGASRLQVDVDGLEGKSISVMRRVQQQRSSNTQKGAVKATPAMPGKGSKRGRRETSTCPGTQAPESAEAEWTRWRTSRCAVSLMGCGIKTAEKCELLVRCVANVCWSVHKAIYCTVPVFQLSAFSFQPSAPSVLVHHVGGIEDSRRVQL